MTLTEFVAARLDEEETAARIAELRFPGPWETAEAGGGLPGAVDLFAAGDEISAAVVRGSYLADYLIRHDPARVLREVAAKRAILAWWQRGDRDPEGPAPSPTYENYRKSLPGYQLLLHLAAVWSDHPDYEKVTG